MPDELDLEAIEQQVRRRLSDLASCHALSKSHNIILEFSCALCAYIEGGEQVAKDIQKAAERYRRVVVERDTYLTALRRYGKHEADCECLLPGSVRPSGRCTCGLLDALRRD